MTRWAVLLLAFAASGHAQDAAPLETLLKDTGLTYTKSASGKSYVLLFDHEKQRRQTVYVGVEPLSIKGLPPVHRVYTGVWVGKAEPPPELLRKALLMTKKFGSFYVFKDASGVFAIRFAMRYIAGPENSAAVAELKDIILFVNQVGEEADIALNGAANDLR